jgi:diaminopimelate decarboxylase
MSTVRPTTFQKLATDIMVGDCSLTELAHTYGTPLYILDEQTIRKNCQQFTQTLTKHYPDATVAYASKAALNIGIANIVASENCGADVVSGGELYTVLKSNIDKTKIYFHGNNKSKEELDLAITHNIHIIVDNPYELSLIETIATEKNTPANILFRIKPGIEAHTHEYIKTGHIDSKFGLTLTEALPLIQQVHASEWGEFLGIHAHIGSQIFDTQPYQDLITILVDAIKTLKNDHNIPVKQLNCGGGFGIQYKESDQAPDIPQLLAKMIDIFKTQCNAQSIPLPHLIFEPGRSIIANAGLTLYTVGAIKEIPNVKDYIFIDGGMADNPRPIMYQAEYTYDIVNPTSPDRKPYAIAGKFCESGDILAHNIELPIVKPNDHLVVYGTGAYNYSMASNYNRFCKPAMVLLNNGNSKLIVQRETYADIVQHDTL